LVSNIQAHGENMTIELVFEEFKSNLKENFERVNYFKPKSSRKESREIYVIAKNIRYN